MAQVGRLTPRASRHAAGRGGAATPDVRSEYARRVAALAPAMWAGCWSSSEFRKRGLEV